MSAETELYAVLAADAGLDALVDGRIYPDAIPEDKPLPAVCYARVETDPIRTVSGQKVGETVRLQIVAWAETRTAADQVGDAVEAALEAAFIPATDRSSGIDPETGSFASTIETEILVT